MIRTFNPAMKRFSRPAFDPGPVNKWKVAGAILLAIAFVSFVASVN